MSETQPLNQTARQAYVTTDLEASKVSGCRTGRLALRVSRVVSLPILGLVG